MQEILCERVSLICRLAIPLESLGVILIHTLASVINSG